MMVLKEIDEGEAVDRLVTLFGGGPIERFVGIESPDEARKYWSAYLLNRIHQESGPIREIDFAVVVAGLHEIIPALNDLNLHSDGPADTVSNIGGFIRPARQLVDPLATDPPADQQVIGEQGKHDILYFDARLKPDGFAYEWKVAFVMGNPEGFYRLTKKQAGWRCVPPARHPEIVNEGDDSRILVSGMVLMEIRMKEWAKFQAEGLLIAKQQVETNRLRFEGYGFEIPAVKKLKQK